MPYSNDSEPSEPSSNVSLIYIWQAESSILYDAKEPLYKVGMTSFEPYKALEKFSASELIEIADKRIKGSTGTAGVNYKILAVEIAISASGQPFKDHAVHAKLKNYGRHPVDVGTGAKEFFKGPLNLIKAAVRSVVDENDLAIKRAIKQTGGKSKFIPRDEQQDAVDQIKKCFSKKGARFLLNAKPRFGKTATAYHLIDSSPDIKKILIITHRPVVGDAWASDAQWILGDYHYEASQKIPGTVVQDLFSYSAGSSLIRFMSIQDLRQLKDGNFKETTLKALAEQYDLLIVDEEHEGIETALAQKVINEIKRDFTLYLSGTPYRSMTSGGFSPNEIYSWDYVLEQKAKLDWYKNKPGQINPYAGLPSMSMRVVDIEAQILDQMPTGSSFTFNEFFRVNQSKFVYENAVRKFLDISLVEESMPFCKAMRDETRHSLWVLPSDESASAMEAMLKTHPVFGKEYDVIKASGKAAKNILERVKNTITQRPWEKKTITLTVDRLTTGVTVEGWSTALMLSNGTSLSRYIQTIFRIQSPCKDYSIDDQGNITSKSQCYVFDFSPDRALGIVVEIANNSVNNNAQNSLQIESSLSELTDFFPVLSMEGAQMRAYSPATLLEEAKKVAISKAVSSGFNSDTLYDLSGLIREDKPTLDHFEYLAGLIGKASKGDKKKPEGITITDHGILPPPKPKNSSPKPKNSDQQKEKNALIESARAQLERILTALPRMIFGASTEITSENIESLDLQDFPNLYSDSDWGEFMGLISKDLFIKTIPYFNQDVLRGAIKKWLIEVDETDRIGDPIERGAVVVSLLNHIYNPRKEVVFTPYKVVETTYQLADVQWDTSPSIYDVNIKSGVFALYAAQQMAELTASKNWDEIIQTFIFANSTTKAGKMISQKVLGVSRESSTADNFTAINTIELKEQIKEYNISSKRQRRDPILDIESFVAEVLIAVNIGFMRKSGGEAMVEKSLQAKKLLDEGEYATLKELLSILDLPMFDYCISNPPYTKHVKDVNTGAGQQVYLDFMIMSTKLAHNVAMITPARWFNSTNEENLRKRIRTEGIDKRFEKLYRWEKSKTFFPTVDFGAVSISIIGPDDSETVEFYEEEKLVSKHALFSENSGAVVFDNITDSIVGKALSHGTMCKPENYHDGLRKIFKEKYQARSTDILLKHLQEKPDQDHPIRVRMPKEGWLYGDKEHFPIHVPQGKFGFAFSHASHDSNKVKGHFNDRQMILRENEAAKSTFVLYFDSLIELYRFYKYTRTSFFGLLVDTRMSSHNAYIQAYAHVPMFDFSKTSIIDWDKNPEEINVELLKHFKLNKEEKDLVSNLGYVYTCPLYPEYTEILANAGIDVLAELKA